MDRNNSSLTFQTSVLTQNFRVTSNLTAKIRLKRIMVYMALSVKNIGKKSDFFPLRNFAGLINVDTAFVQDKKISFQYAKYFQSFFQSSLTSEAIELVIPSPQSLQFINFSKLPTLQHNFQEKINQNCFRAILIIQESIVE